MGGDKEQAGRGGWTVGRHVGLWLIAAGSCQPAQLGDLTPAPEASQNPGPSSPQPAETSDEPAQMTTTPPASPTPTPDVPAGATGDCAQSQAIVCDDFEGTDIGSAPDAKLWQVQQQNPSSKVTVQGERAHSGSRSLHITTPSQGFERAVVVNTAVFPQLQNNLFGRVFMYFEGTVPQIHFNLVSAAGLLPGQNKPTSVNYGGQYGIFLANYYNANNPAAVLDLWQHAGVPMAGGTWADATVVPHDVWACLEWQFEVPTGQMRMWLDDKSIDRMHVDGRSADCCPNDPWTQPLLTGVEVGLTVVGNQEAFTGFSLWLDGLALGSARIGCAKP